MKVYENEFVFWIRLNILVGTNDIIADNKRYKCYGIILPGIPNSVPNPPSVRAGICRVFLSLLRIRL